MSKRDTFLLANTKKKCINSMVSILCFDIDALHKLARYALGRDVMIGDKKVGEIVSTNISYEYSKHDLIYSLIIDVKFYKKVEYRSKEIEIVANFDIKAAYHPTKYDSLICFEVNGVDTARPIKFELDGVIV